MSDEVEERLARERMFKDGEGGSGLTTPSEGAGNPLWSYSKDPIRKPLSGQAYTAFTPDGSLGSAMSPGIMKEMDELKDKAVAVDFDGTITQDNKGTVNPDVQKVIFDLLNRGVRVVIFSARPAPEIEQWLKDHNWPALEVTNIKSHDFVVYLDDRAMNFGGNAGVGLADKLSGFKAWWEKSAWAAPRGEANPNQPITPQGVAPEVKPRRDPALRDNEPFTPPAGIQQPMALSAPIVPPVSRTVDMVEEGRIVVRHIFYGRDEAEAKHMEEAHRDADASLDASLSGRPYKGVEIEAVRKTAGPALILVRHGSTDFNSGESEESGPRIRGWIDVPLNSDGRAEAKKVAARIAEDFPKVDQIKTSDLSRAQDTARAISRACDGVPVEDVEELRPWDLGDYNGQKVAGIEDKLNALCEHPDEKAPDGESLHDFLERFLPYLYSQMEEVKETGDVTVLVAHTRNVRAAACMIQDKDFSPARLMGDNDIVDPGGYVIIRPKDDDWTFEVHTEKVHDAGVQPESEDLKPKFPAGGYASGPSILRSEDEPRDEAGRWTASGVKLSPHQAEMVNHIAAHGGRIERLPGGFWTGQGSERVEGTGQLSGYKVPKTYTTVPTVRSLEKKGVLERTNEDTREWADTRRLKTPIKKAWDESQHPREAAGSPVGGQFAGTGGGGGGDDFGWATRSPADRERQGKLESEAKEGRQKVAALWNQIIGKTGSESLADIRTWEDVPPEWKADAYHEWSKAYMADKFSNLSESEAEEKAKGQWDGMLDEQKLQAAKTHLDADQYTVQPEEVKTPEFDDSEQGGEEEAPKMTVEDFGNWDSLPGDWQDKTYEKWAEDTQHEFLENEIESWRDEESNFEHIPGEVATDDSWLKEELNTLHNDKDSFLYPGEEAANDEEAQRRTDEWRGSFDLDKSVDNGAFEIDEDGKLSVDTDKLEFRDNPYEDESQRMLPGISREDMSAAFKKARWESIEDQYTDQVKEDFKKEVEQRTDDAKENPPDYLSDNIKEYQQEAWDNMSDKQKYKFAKNYLSDEEIASDNPPTTTSGEQGPLKEPDQWKTLHDGEDYKMTGRIGRRLAVERAIQVAEERGLKSIANKEMMENIQDNVWSDWKASSTSNMGQALQVAAHEELGANLNKKFGEGIIDNTQRRLGADNYNALKCYTRGLWDTSQFLLSKEGRSNLNVYRGVIVPNDVLAKEPTEHIDAAGADLDLTRYTNMSIGQNGASSWTTKRSVANEWQGVGTSPKNGSRVVLRARVPATAVLGLPTYGRNFHEEQEVVVLGTPWKKWDAWHKTAPVIGESEAGGHPIQ